MPNPNQDFKASSRRELIRLFEAAILLERRYERTWGGEWELSVSGRHDRRQSSLARVCLKVSSCRSAFLCIDDILAALDISCLVTLGTIRV